LQIVNVNAPDTGGQCFRLSRAINIEYKGQHESRSFVRKQHKRKFPYDVALLKVRSADGSLPAWITRCWSTADVIHCHADWGRVQGWPMPSKKAGYVIQQHGRFATGVRCSDLRKLDRETNSLRIVSTLNLLKYVDDDATRWLPAPIDLVAYGRLSRRYRDRHDTVRVKHAPTSRELKHTQLFVEVMERIKAAHRMDVEVWIVENRPYSEVLRLRAQADICFDQLLLQHGNSGLEAMALGQPVIAGCSDAVCQTFKRVVGYVPFLRADPASLQDVLEKLIFDPAARRRWARRGRRYIRKWHANPQAAKIAIGMYNKAIGMR